MTGGWQAELDVRTGKWRAVKELERKGEFGPVCRMRAVRDLRLPMGATRAEAEAEMRRLRAIGLL